MPATPINMTFDGPMEERKSFATFEPGIYPATVTKVEDYDNGRTKGWIFHYDIDGLPFRDYIAVQENTRWKIEQTIRPFDPDAADLVKQGVMQVDPNDYVGMSCMAEVGYSERTNQEGIPYKEIKSTWSPDLPPPTRVDYTPEPVDPF